MSQAPRPSNVSYYCSPCFEFEIDQRGQVVKVSIDWADSVHDPAGQVEIYDPIKGKDVLFELSADEDRFTPLPLDRIVDQWILKHGGGFNFEPILCMIPNTTSQE